MVGIMRVKNPHDRAVARLADISAGGKTGAKNDDLRRCLSDVARYNAAAQVVGGIFPIAADHSLSPPTMRKPCASGWKEGIPPSRPRLQAR